ncbi:cobalamin biosynthesis protein [Burkholderia sp. WSM2230]|uniref:cobalamin biosynthesis protein n=1 Tax=Burkholderia sp. WSM2230 TaxID=944435 RepID=UPI000422471D|nr:cobalamin biosynthesis protein [Burkholderia sp. WSM2230]
MKTLSVGIGCRLHTSADDIENAVRAALGSHAFEDIVTVASIETKADEAGLLEFCARHGFPLQLFSRERIAAMRVMEPSKAAREHLGVGGVSEPCALLGALHLALQNSRAGTSAQEPSPALAECIAHEPSAATAESAAQLIVGKTVCAGVTVAIASARRTKADSATHTQQDLP